MLQEVVPERLSLLQRRWLLKQGDEDYITDIRRRFGLGESAARLLATRDINLDDIENFLNPKLKDLLPDPYIFADMQKAVECIYNAIASGESLVLYGDYDVDGGSSTAMLADYLKTIGHKNLQVYIPDRFEEGYGVNEAAIDNFHSQGHKTIITMDCGTASLPAMTRAKQHGMRVVVLDHHKPESAEVGAYAFVNPNRDDKFQDDKVRENYGHLAAVGVTFLFIVGLNRHLREVGYFGKIGEPDLWQFLDLVALGTVCDVVPLRGVNRAFVRHGLRIIGKGEGREGLQNLCAVSKLSSTVTAMDLGFALGPRLNAASRMGESSLAVQLLMSCDYNESVAISHRLDELNKQRRQMQEDQLAHALSVVEDMFQKSSHRSHIVIADASWQIGLVGILAARIKDLYNMPCIVIGGEAGEGSDSHDSDIGRGSGRSVAGFDLGSAIMAAARAGIILNGGGHAMAAGLSIDLSQVGALDKFLADYIDSNGVVVNRDLEVDLSLSLGSLKSHLWEELDLLEPFGSGHGLPNVLFSCVRVGDVRVLDGGHVSCRLFGLDGASARGIVFGGSVGGIGSELLGSRGGDEFDIVGRLSRPYGQSNVGSVMIDDLVKL